MAGDWIKMRTDLLTSPKVVRMSSALKADRFRIVGGLLSVWSLFDSHSTDGTLSGYTLESLDDLAAWDGFSAAMVAVGWLECEGDDISLPRFEAHNGASSKRRALDSSRKRAVRNSSASDADKKRTREEKRREEKKENNPLPPEGMGEGNQSKPAGKYSDDFEAFWREYPKRDRAASKPDAWKAWTARLKAGVPARDLIQAAINYRVDQTAKGKVGTEYVKLPATFLGKGEHWKSYLGPQPQLPARPGAKPSNFTNLPKHTPDMYQEEPDHDGPNF